MKRKKNFTQVCVWEGTVVGKTKIKEFISFMKETFDIRVQYLEEVKTLSDIADGQVVKKTGGRNDLFFAIHSNDISKFAIKRLQYNIRWVEDVLANEKKGHSIYPVRISKYKTL